MLDFTKKFCVLGAGKSALAAALRLKKMGAEVFVSDCGKKSLADLKKLGVDFEVGGHTQKVLECDYLVVSPGIPLSVSIIQKAKEKGCEILSEMELGYRLKPAETKVIAVTGTNGKSTVVSLIKHILDVAGVSSELAGNIGIPITSIDFSQKKVDYLVLELSSFQLELLDNFKADVALFLNFTKDHQDRYSGMFDYFQAKKNIFNNQTEKDKSIVSKEIAGLDLEKTPLFVEDFLQNGAIEVDGFSFVNANPKLLGEHNFINIAFAVLATIGVVQPTKIQEAINSFQPPKHRLEVFAKKNGVTYVNDSKATTIRSTECALDAFSQKVIVILGGSDKGEDFAQLLPKLQEKAKKVFLIGETGKKMATIFGDKIDCEYFQNLENCVSKSKAVAQQGDIVLLSPACASYDMFDNFEQRGEIFKSLVTKS